MEQDNIQLKNRVEQLEQQVRSLQMELEYSNAYIESLKEESSRLGRE